LHLIALLLAFQAVAAPAAEPLSVRIDTAAAPKPISPYIYGQQHLDWPGAKYTPFARAGGNRLTAYNWENNASNAGSDWNHQNDSLLGQSDVSGDSARKWATGALQSGKVFLMTLPMAGYVSADKKGDGDVKKTRDYLETRFRKSMPRKPGGAFVYPPDTKDQFVYQDEFVAWIEKVTAPLQKRTGGDIWYSLDNEPDLWNGTHARIVPQKLTYARLRDLTVDLASAVKDVSPDALVFGPVSYGYAGFMNLQSAPDANGRGFLQFYLQEMAAAEKRLGRRLVDVLDVHYYSEARGGGKRVTEEGDNPALIAARIQSPRSLWDPSYVEDSWISRDVLGGKPVRLLPWLQEMIDKDYPGTRLGMTEYYFGGGNHISGAIVQADVLGIFGREGVFAAALWPLNDRQDYVKAAFDAYRNVDGQGRAVGDLSLPVEQPDPERLSVYAMSDSKQPGKVSLVLINKTARPLAVKVEGVDGATWDRFEIAGAAGVKRKGKARAAEAVQLPSMSVTTLLPE
jgi:hypothetical protein